MHPPSEPPALRVQRRQQLTRRAQHKVRGVLLIEIDRSASFDSYLTTGLRELVNKSLPGRRISRRAKFLILSRSCEAPVKTGFGVEPTGTR